MPRVLLSAPVNATWAANHTDYWHTKGIHGFLLHGILDVCQGSVWARDGEPKSVGADDAMLQEVRFAQRRLAEAGLGDNFLLTRFPPGFRAIEQPTEADASIAAIGDAAEFVQRAGLRGLALDSASSELPYHAEWDGYALRDGAGLREGAVSLGRRIAQAVAARAPESELLLIYDGPADSGPLWPALFEGVVRGARTARFRGLHLLTRASFDATGPAEFVDALALENDYLALHTDPDVLDYWTKHGAIAPGLRPVQQPQPGGEVYSAYPMAAFRVQCAAAKLAAPAYVWIESAGQTWWQVDPEDAPSYEGLHQLGEEMQEHTKALPTYLSGLSAATPIDSLVRVESLSTPLPDHIVLTDKAGAAVVLWPGKSLPLNADEHPEAVTDLATGTTSPVADGASSITADSAPLLVHGLSVAQRVVPASLWIAYRRDSVARWPDALPFQFGIANRTAFSLNGVIDVLPPLHWDVPAGHQQVALEPSQTLDVQSVLRGPWRAGNHLDIRSSIAIPGAPVRTRSWALEIPPKLAWHALFPGATVNSPLWRDVDAQGTPEILVTSSGGDLACLDATGPTRWAISFRRGIRFPPVAGRAPAGWEAVAAIDRDRTLHIVRADGQQVAEQALPERPLQPPCVADLNAFAGDELVVAMPSGLVQAWRMDGVLLWEQRMTNEDPFLIAAPHEGDVPAWVVVAGASLAVLDGAGETRASFDLPAPANCQPVVGDSDADGLRDILVGLRDGAIVRIQDGVIAPLLREDGAGTVSEITRAPDGTILVVDAQGVHAFDGAWKSRWTWEGANVRACVPIAGLSAARYLITQDNPARVVCLSDQGVVEWQDAAPLWGPVSAPAATVAGALVRIAYGSGDGALRVREFHAE